MMSNPEDSIAVQLAEFISHTWDHSNDQFQQIFDERRYLTTEEVQQVQRAVRIATAENSRSSQCKALRKLLTDDPSTLLLILQLTGLTRNKILQDLKATDEGRRLKIPTKPAKLTVNSDVWNIACDYLLRAMQRVFSKYPDSVNEPSLQIANQATWPGWIRQERAKRQGHEAEYRLASMLRSIGLPFEPQEKADNPLCRDVIIHGISFDVVVPNTKTPRLCFKATVHTSNIGQFGQSKDALEVGEARRMIELHYPGSPPLLAALIDGVGFHTNRQGIEGVLRGTDFFCQFRTIWKAAVAAAHVTNANLEVVLPAVEIDCLSDFIETFGANSKFITTARKDADYVVAGDALIRKI